MSELLEKLKQELQPYCKDGIVLGFSGGVDSSLLLAVLSLLRKEQDFPAAAVMMRSSFQSDSECQEAENLAKQYSIPFVQLCYEPLSIPEIKNNCRERCYFCKKYFFTKIFSFAEAENMKHILDGTNSDDLKKYRPGLRAIRELGVHSPLAESGFSKEEIRSVSRELGLSTAEKPAMPCLATRFDYDLPLTEEKLRLVSRGEQVIRQMIPAAAEIRLRIERDDTRIEISREQISKLIEQQEKIFEKLHQIGFEKIIIDQQGYRSGSFDNFFSFSD